jgi:hypothetical protein
VAAEARAAFESVFPLAKRAPALLFAHAEILDLVGLGFWGTGSGVYGQR